MTKRDPGADGEERRPRLRGLSPPTADRAEPVGEPVVRSDPAVTGDRADEAVGFDPDDPESVALAAEIVREFAETDAGVDDNVFMLRGAAACAALVRGVGSYKAATNRVDGAASIPFLRKWARVHDLPQAIRRHVARGNIPPTAAKHIARVSGDARFYLAWATLDGSLTVRAVRRAASDINDGTPVEEALAAEGVTLGELTIQLPPELYRDLRRRASLEDRDPADVTAAALTRALAPDGE